ncbi:MAG: MBOAT family protein [Roseivirga sp.]|nr:MBOAT family protein [Roseivirga sp.]
MLFNSFEYAIFLPVVFLIYWFVVNKNLKLQNLALLCASYLFYGWWDYRFLLLIFISTVADYVLGQKIEGTDNLKLKRLFLRLSVLANLGLLGFFKYYNFFIESWINAWGTFGVDFSGSSTLNIILPVGISFYTFQTMSYSLDIYKGQLKPTKDFIAFGAFVSFFPQLVAGPIERASNLLPQILRKRVFNAEDAKDGLRQILMGLFKKVLVADTLAKIVESTFSGDESLSASTLAVGAVCFSFQIYADFSGYSDIAIGTAKLFGVRLMTNFRFPFFSRSISEFWRRWHISLYSWLNDYVFLPLNIRFRFWGKIGLLLAVWMTFGISGLWHGAGWNYVLFGLIQAAYLTPVIFFGKLGAISSRKLKKSDRLSSKGTLLRDIFKMLLTFILINISFIFFRAPTVAEGWNYVVNLFDASLFSPPFLRTKRPFIFLIILILMEWFNRDKEHAMEWTDSKTPRWVRWGIYYAIIAMMFLFGGETQEFIYFQF